MKIIYAKKFRFPDHSANIIQGINMVAAFAHNGAHVKSLFSFSNDIIHKHDYILNTYGLSKTELGETTFISKSARGFRYFTWLLWSVLKESSCIIYTRENKEFRTALQIKKATRKKIHIVHEIHKIEPLANSSLQKGINFFRQLEQASGLIFIEESLRNYVTKQLKTDVPSYVSPSGVNLNFFSSQSNYCTPSSNEILLGYFGNITEEKGAYLLADTLHHLPHNFRLKCVGRVSSEARSEILKRINNEASRIIFTGHVNPTELPTVMSDVHISIIPSISQDKFLSPLKLTESLALGIPIVCTPAPHLTRIVRNEKHALIASSFSPIDLAKAISKLAYSNELMRSMSFENTKYASCFSWDFRAKNILKFIKKIQNLS